MYSYGIGTPDMRHLKSCPLASLVPFLALSGGMPALTMKR